MATQRLLVSIDITTKSMSLADLTRLVGIAPAPRAADIGTPTGRKKYPVNQYTMWSLYSAAPKEAPFETHVESILARIPGSLWDRMDQFPEDVDFCLDVMLLFDVYEPLWELDIPVHSLSALSQKGIRVEVRGCPCNGLEPDPSHQRAVEEQTPTG